MAANVLESIDALFSGQGGDGGKGDQEGVQEDPSVIIEDPDAVTEIKPKTHANDLEDLDKFIEDEMERRKTGIGMTWRKLDKCFKWQALKDHLMSLGVSSTDELYKKVEALLKSNDLATTVEYNKEEKKITRINHPDVATIYS